MDDYIPLILNWIDALWIPAALFIVHKKQRIKAVLFILACMLALRLQAEMIEMTGFKHGFTGLFEGSVFKRGQIFYSVCIAIYLILSYYSPRTRGVIYMAASLSIFFMAFVGSMVLMSL
jgi:hypothetical protein